MPLFPKISNLTLKQILSGEETIQISASERTTLAKIAELTLSKALTEFTSTLEQSVEGTEITSNDTILTAISKLFARVGSDKSAVFPVRYDDYFGIVGYLTTNPQLDQTIFSITFHDGDMYPEIWYGVRNIPADALNTTPGELMSWLDNSGKKIDIGPGFEFKRVSIGNVAQPIGPGNIISLESDNRPMGGFQLFAEDWVLEGSSLGGKTYSASVTSKINLLDSDFIPSRLGWPSTVETFFSDGFNTDPGTTWQKVDIQMFKSGNIYRFFFTKMGYNNRIS